MGGGGGGGWGRDWGSLFSLIFLALAKIGSEPRQKRKCTALLMDESLASKLIKQTKDTVALYAWWRACHLLAVKTGLLTQRTMAPRKVTYL